VELQLYAAVKINTKPMILTHPVSIHPPGASFSVLFIAFIYMIIIHESTMPPSKNHD